MHEILEMPVDYCAKSFSCRNPDAQSCATSEQAARKDTDLNNIERPQLAVYSVDFQRS